LRSIVANGDPKYARGELRAAKPFELPLGARREFFHQPCGTL